MKLDHDIQDQRLSLDVTPLIDVVFLLVLFFAVTTSFISPRELGELKDSVFSLGREKEALDEEVARVSSALEARIAQIERLGERNRALAAEHAAALAERRAALARLESDLDASREEARKMQWMIDALESEQAGLEKTLAESGERNESLREQLEQAFADYRGLEVRYAGLAEEHRRQAHGLAEASAALDAAAGRERSLLAERDRLRATTREQAERAALLDALIAEKAAAAAALEERLAASGEARAALERSLAARGEENAALAERASGLAASLEAKVDEERLLRALLAEKAAAATDLEARLSAAGGEREALAAELEGLRALAAERATANRALGERLAALEAELDGYRKVAALDAEQVERVLRAQESLRAGLAADLAEKRVGIRRERQRLTLQLSDRILFDSGSATIKPAGLTVLRRVGEALRDRLGDLQLQIGGHTDNVPVGGGRGGLLTDNWGLSAARAVSVVDFLEREVGLDSRHLSAVGYGEHRPVASNDTPEGRAANRRIEIVLLPR